MNRLTRRISGILAVVTCGLFLAQGAFGDPVLVSINANYLETQFTGGGGVYGLGVLTVSDGANIVVEYDDEGTSSQMTYDGGSFLLTASLMSDLSAGDMASGIFRDGQLTVEDGVGTDLLTGDLAELQLDEVVNDLGLIAGVGLFEVTGGALADDFGTVGDVVQIGFMVDPKTLSDFVADFTAQSDITLVPREGAIPEPASLLLIGSGALLLGFRRRKR